MSLCLVVDKLERNNLRRLTGTIDFKLSAQRANPRGNGASYIKTRTQVEGLVSGVSAVLGDTLSAGCTTRRTPARWQTYRCGNLTLIVECRKALGRKNPWGRYFPEI